ncbi:MAG: Crp/Fnr family transcriptional regulator [Bacteroidetes bacterium]|nr:Crp/Fnr family transcriptional regulator [Bacteroidota bacterium]
MQQSLFDFIEQYIILTEEEKKCITDLDIFRSVKKGTLLLSEGQCSRSSIFVLKGLIRTFYIVDGEEKTTEFYAEMEGISPPCVLSGLPSELYISCVEDAMISVSDPGMESEVFRKFPRFESLCRILSEQLLSKNQCNFDTYKTSSPEQRYLHLLKNRSDLLNRVPQHQLASYLGIKPQSLSRLRARLVKKKK